MQKNIVLCFDRNFIIPIATLLKSIELSNANETFVIHIVTADLPDESKIKFEFVSDISVSGFLATRSIPSL